MSTRRVNSEIKLFRVVDGQATGATPRHEHNDLGTQTRKLSRKSARTSVLKDAQLKVDKHQRRASMHNQTTIQNGFLGKFPTTGLVKKFQQRWFVLSGHYLKYAHAKPQKDNESIFDGVYNLSEVVRIEYPESSQDIFVLHFVNGDELKLQARSSQNAEVWVDNLSRVSSIAIRGSSTLLDVGGNGDSACSAQPSSPRVRSRSQSLIQQWEGWSKGNRSSSTLSDQPSRPAHALEGRTNVLEQMVPQWDSWSRRDLGSGGDDDSCSAGGEGPAALQNCRERSSSAWERHRVRSFKQYQQRNPVPAPVAQDDGQQSTPPTCNGTTQQSGPGADTHQPQLKTTQQYASTATMVGTIVVAR